MANTIIQVQGISKQYRLGKIGTGSFTHDVNRWWHKIRGKEDPYLKIGETNDRRVKGESDYVWSLRDISFNIQSGDAVGIIGRNGAGKSTLLKILSRVTAPTEGRIKAKGRIASLLEVGTGFHPELTGRENVYLNGAILGMRKKEIADKFDEIVAFAGVERYIDTPVKRYSSGMYVRLAFAVAAHLESEILIVDEVLAVGDAEFQKKCLGKMQNVNQNEGRTVLFVSHNMNAINRLCNSGIILSNGTLSHQGKVQDVVERYLSNELSQKKSYAEFETKEHVDVQIMKAFLVNRTSNMPIEQSVSSSDNVDLIIQYIVNIEIKNLHLSFYIKNSHDEIVFFSDLTDTYGSYIKVSPGTYKVRLQIPNPLLTPGQYSVSFGCVNQDNRNPYHELDALFFELVELNKFRANRPGYINIPLQWQLEPVL
jgi:lipopolysaccharide transport system ATP-binding protein